MKIAWFTPYSSKSAIGRFSFSVTESLALRGHELTLVSSDEHELAEHRPPPNGIELLHWSFLEQHPAAFDRHDLIVYNIGDSFPYHCGVLRLIDRYPGVCIFHDFYLASLFLGWLASGVDKAVANSVLSSNYGETIAKEFWDRLGQADFQEWSAAQAPMTEWLARKALAAIGHAEFYKRRLEESCPNCVLVLPLAYVAPKHRRITEALSGRVHLLTVGLVNSNKRVESVIEAITFSPVLRGRCEYNIVGRIEPAYRAKLLSLIEESGLENVVKLHGEVTDYELGWRFAEADIVCCLRWPALEGASASCIEAMSYGKPVIVTDTGFYSSIPSDRVLKVRPANEIADLTFHLERLVADVGERNELGKRARDWAELEHAPEKYAERIEPLLEATVETRPAADSLKVKDVNLPGTEAERADLVGQRIASECSSAPCSGSHGETERPAIDARTDSVKPIFNPLENREPQIAPGPPHLRAGKEVQIDMSPTELNVGEVYSPPAELLLPMCAPLAPRSGDEKRSPSIGAGVRAVLWRLGVLCTKPILSRLRSYFVEPLTDLILEQRHRLGGIEQSIGAIQAGIGAIQAQLGTQEQSIQAEISKEAAENRRVDAQMRQQTYIVREKLEALAARVDRAETQSINAHQLMEILANRNVLVLGEELLALTPYGFLLAPADDLECACFLSEGKIWEPTAARLLDLIVREGMTFIDVGANIGNHTLHGARMVGPTGSVIAFEPTPAIFQFLQKSVQLAGLGDVCRCINIAISSSEGLATLHVSSTSGRNSLYPLGEEEKAMLPVRTATLDQVLLGTKRIDVVKIDVAGAELEVLAGMKDTLANHRDIVLVVKYNVPLLGPTGVDSSEWFTRFFANEFASFAIDESTGTWHQVVERETNQLSSGNVVFVRPGTSQYAIVKKHEVSR